MEITPFDLAGSLQAHNQLLAQNQGLQDQNALAQAVPLLQSDPQNAFATAARTSPNAALKLLPVIQQMKADKRQEVADRTAALGKMAFTLQQYKDPVIRKAVAQSMAPDLAAHGITPEQIQGFDYSDQSMNTLVNTSRTVGDLIDQSNKDRTFAFDQSKAAETARHNRADEHNSSITAQAALANATSGNKQWQVLTDPKAGIQYRYNPVTGKSTTLDGTQPYAPQGAQKIGGGMARSAASLAATMFVQEHPDATAQDVANFAADYAKGVKSVSAFATGKQGDLVRSFNVAVSHLNTLDSLVGALNNGDIQAFNKFGNAVAQQTGSPAPTNFDAAKAIVGDEIIKAIVGSGGALADRENAQNQISRASSPAQLRGVIKTYKELMAGQLRGLKKQYTDTTGRSDFESHLSPEARAELEPAAGSAAPATSAGWSNFKVHN